MTSRLSFPPQKDMSECLNNQLLKMNDTFLKEEGVVDKTAEVFANRTMTRKEVADEASAIHYSKANLPPFAMESALVKLILAIDKCADKKKF